MSIACCGTVDEDSDLDEEEDHTRESAPEAGETDGEESPIGIRWLSLAQQRAQYRVVTPNPEVAMSAFELWQQKYNTSGGAPDTKFVEMQCYCHTNLDRSLELVAEIEARCFHTQFVSFRHLEEDHEGATMRTECWPHPR